MTQISMQEVRAKFPQYDDLSDQQLGEAIHSRFYADMPKEKFLRDIGLTKPKLAAYDDPAVLAREDAQAREGWKPRADGSMRAEDARASAAQVRARRGPDEADDARAARRDVTSAEAPQMPRDRNTKPKRTQEPRYMPSLPPTRTPMIGPRALAGRIPQAPETPDVASAQALPPEDPRVLGYAGGSTPMRPRRPMPGTQQPPVSPASPFGTAPAVQPGYEAPVDRQPNVDATDDARAGRSRVADTPPAAEPPLTEVDPERSAFVQDVQRLARDGQIERAISQITVGLNTGKYGAVASPAGRVLGGIGDYFTETQEGGEENRAARAQASAASEWFRGDEARALFEANPDLIAEAAADPVAFMQAQGQGPQATTVQPPVQPPANAPATPGQPPAAAPNTRGPLRTALPYGPTQDHITDIAQVPPPGSPPATPGAAVAQGAASMAANPEADRQGETATNPQAAQAMRPETFEEHYRTNVIPQKIAYLRDQGEFERAQAMAAELETANGQAMLREFSLALTDAAVGNERGFFERAAKVFNMADDGYELMPEQSDLYADEEGNSRAKLTLRDTRTGEVFEQDLPGGQQFINTVLGYIDPISQLERAMATAEAEAAAAAEQQQWEIEQSRAAVTDNRANQRQVQQLILQSTLELSQNDHNWTNYTPEERAEKTSAHVAQALAAYQAVQGISLASRRPPVTYTGQ